MLISLQAGCCEYTENENWYLSPLWGMVDEIVRGRNTKRK